MQFCHFLLFCLQVSPVPDVYVYDLHKSKEQFIILASDGLWNMIRPLEAVRLVGDLETTKDKEVFLTQKVVFLDYNM